MEYIWTQGSICFLHMCPTLAVNTFSVHALVVLVQVLLHQSTSQIQFPRSSSQSPTTPSSVLTWNQAALIKWPLLIAPSCHSTEHLFAVTAVIAAVVLVAASSCCLQYVLINLLYAKCLAANSRQTRLTVEHKEHFTTEERDISLGSPGKINKPNKKVNNGLGMTRWVYQMWKWAALPTCLLRFYNVT